MPRPLLGRAKRAGRNRADPTVLAQTGQAQPVRPQLGGPNRPSPNRLGPNRPGPGPNRPSQPGGPNRSGPNRPGPGPNRPNRAGSTGLVQTGQALSAGAPTGYPQSSVFLGSQPAQLLQSMSISATVPLINRTETGYPLLEMRITSPLSRDTSV